MQWFVEKRFAGNLFFTAGYTWSRALDMGGGGNSASAEGRNNVQNPRNIRAEYGLADFNFSHRVTFSGVYNLPFLSIPNSAFDVSAVTNGMINLSLAAQAIGGTLWSSIPVWYPSVPPVLASDNFADKGSASIPSACSVPSSVGSQATQIDEQRVHLDTILGELERTNQSSYVVPPFGVVCVVVHDDLQSYYDFSGQSMYLFNNTPLRETVTDETIGMTGVPAASSKTTAARRPMQTSLASFVAPSTARIHLALAKQRLQFVRRLRSALKEAR